MFPLLEGCIITGFSRTLLARQTLVESASIRLAACLSRPALFVCLTVYLTVCLPSVPLPLLVSLFDVSLLQGT